MVDGLLYHETDLKIREHYTDTGGYTELVFATLSMLGFRFAPRIRHLGDLCLYALEPPATYPTLELLIRGTVNLKRLETYWDDILRLGASIQTGNRDRLVDITQVSGLSAPEWPGARAAGHGAPGADAV